MQVFRTVIWVVLLVALLAFSFFNWTPVEVRIWTNLILETKLPALVIVAFLLGLVPMWLVHRGNMWRMKRRITALEAVTTRLSAPASPMPTDTTSAAAPPRDLPPQPGNPIDPEPTRPA